MPLACLEHTNLTTNEPDKLADLFCDLFDWHIRWSGPSLGDGYTVHVGTDKRYLALYRPKAPILGGRVTNRINNLNHIGLRVKDAKSLEERVVELGFETYSHVDYGDCKSFYFMADPALEIEIVEYV